MRTNQRPTDRVSPAAPAVAGRGAAPVPRADAPGPPGGEAGFVVRGCTCFRVRRLARRVTQIYDRVLAPSGLRVTQYSLLAALIRTDAMPVGALATVLDMDRTTLTRNLKPLVDADLVSLMRSAADARQREARVTDAGRARHDDAKRLWRRAQDEINRMLGEPQTASLHRLFDGLLETLDGYQRPATGNS